LNDKRQIKIKASAKGGTTHSQVLSGTHAVAPFAVGLLNAIHRDEAALRLKLSMNEARGQPPTKRRKSATRDQQRICVSHIKSNEIHKIFATAPHCTRALGRQTLKEIKRKHTK